MTDDVSGPGGPFVFRGRLTEDDAVDLRCCIYRFTFRKPVRWLGALVAVAAAAVVASEIAITGVSPLTPVCLASVAILLVVLPHIPAWTARRHYRRHRDQFREAEVRLTPERVFVATDVSRSEFAWSLLGGVVDAPRGLMFFDKGKRVLFWLPDRLFEGETRRRVLALASLDGVRVHRA